MLTHSTSKMIQTAIQKKQTIYAVRLPFMKGKMGKEVQPGRRIGSEISSYVKVKTGLQGLLHGDELPNHGITQEEINDVLKILHAHDKDSFAMVIGDAHKATHAIDVIKSRVSQLLEGVPEETRNALEGGNSEYSRPLPGAARMYPETDAYDIPIHEKTLNEMKQKLPMWTHERKKYYMKKGLSEKLAEEMKLDNKARFFEQLLEKGYEPTTSASLLLSTLNTLRRENPNVNALSNAQLESLLAAEKQKLVLRERFPDVLREWAKNPHAQLEQILGHMKIENADEDEVTKIIQQIMEKNQHLILSKGMQAQSALMGQAMQALRGKAQGYFIAQALEKELKKRIEK